MSLALTPTRTVRIGFKSTSTVTVRDDDRFRSCHLGPT